MILDGKTDRLIERLSRHMKRCAKEHRFEEAAKTRDRITAISSLSYQAAGEASAVEEMEDLRTRLGLAHLPERIEAFDISNIHGSEATGSMVSFRSGAADKDNYRRFRIKTVKGIDDYKMLAEVVHRRYLRLKGEGLPLPDLILIDGGKAHLWTALRQLEALNVVIPVISIAKEHEHVYVPVRDKPLKFPGNSPAINLIRRVRDEAHRFAVAYHHVLHRKKILGR